MIKFTQEFGAHTGRQISLDQPRVRVGRAPGNEIAFDPNLDLDSSGNHCEILREDGAYFLVDLNSRNGTYLNGDRVQKQRLQSGDLIECGRGGPRLRVDVPGSPAVARTSSRAPPPAFGASGPAATEAMSSYGPAGPSVPPGAYPPAVGSASYPQPYVSAGVASPPSQGTPAFGAFAPASQTPPAQAGLVPAGMTPGSAAVANLPVGAHVGKRTMALMIDSAIQQAGVKNSHAHLRVVVVALALLVVGGFAVGAYFLWLERADTDQRIAEMGGDGNAGERIAQQSESAIYMLASVQAGQPPQGFCTGFAVSADLIATNAHCVDAAQDFVANHARTIVALRNNGHGAQLQIQPIYRDPRFRNPQMGSEGSGYDVGLFRTTTMLPNVVRLVSLADAIHLQPGANLYVYGFPGMTMNEVSPVATITAGILSRMTDFFDRAADDPAQGLKIQHSAQTTSGSSGSPIFLATGEVIGVNAGSLADEERQSIVDPSTGRRVTVEVNRSSNFKYGMRADLIRAAIQAVGESAP